MILSQYDLTLDVLQPDPQHSITAWLGDTGRQIRFRLRQGANPYPLEPNTTAVFTAKRPDGTVLLHNCSVEADAVLYDFTPQTAAAVGRLSCQLRLYRGELLLTAPRFELVVEDTVCHEEDIPAPESEISLFQGLVSQAQELKDALQTILVQSHPHPQAVELTGGRLEPYGYPQAVTNPLYKLDRYGVLAGRTYRLRGKGVSIADDFPMALFCRSDALGRDNTGAILISGGTDVPKDYDLTFVPETDGWLFIAKYGDNPALTVNGTVYSVNGRAGEVTLTAADVDAYTKAEVEGLLNTFIANHDTYTKAEIDQILLTILPAPLPTYTKDEVDALLDNLTAADVDAYTKAETEALLNTFIANHDTYTKAEIDQILLSILPPPLPTYTKDEVDALLENYALNTRLEAALGSYITDIAAVVGGEA